MLFPCILLRTHAHAKLARWGARGMMKPPPPLKKHSDLELRKSVRALRLRLARPLHRRARARASCASKNFRKCLAEKFSSLGLLCFLTFRKKHSISYPQKKLDVVVAWCCFFSKGRASAHCGCAALALSCRLSCSKMVRLFT